MLGDGGDKVFEFSAAQLRSGGDKTAAVVLGGGGSLDYPRQIGFDRKGNLWVPNGDADTVVMFSKSQLRSSNDDAPAITISGTGLGFPNGLAFDSANLWVLDNNNGDAVEFSSSQLKSTGAPSPKVVLENAATIHGDSEITFGPAYGK